MADAPTPTTPPAPDTAAQPDASATPPATEAPTPDTLGDPGKKALDAERRARRDAERALNEAQAKVKAFEDANKSETERMAEQVAALKAEAEAARSEALRMRVATETGLPAELVEFLPSGVDEETLRAKAATLAAMAAPKGPGKPAPDPAQGAKPGVGGPVQLTRADMDRMTPEQIVEARSKGQFDDLLAGKLT